MNYVEATRWTCDAPSCKLFKKINGESDPRCFVCDKSRYPAGMNIKASEFTPKSYNKVLTPQHTPEKEIRSNTNRLTSLPKAFENEFVLPLNGNGFHHQLNEDAPHFFPNMKAPNADAKPFYPKGALNPEAADFNFQWKWYEVKMQCDFFWTVEVINDFMQKFQCGGKDPKNGYTFLHRVVEDGVSAQAVKMLLETTPLNVHDVTLSGDTPLHLANHKFCHLEFPKDLITEFALLHRNNKGETPLMKFANDIRTTAEDFTNKICDYDLSSPVPEDLKKCAEFTFNKIGNCRVLNAVYEVLQTRQDLIIKVVTASERNEESIVDSLQEIGLLVAEAAKELPKNAFPELMSHFQDQAKVLDQLEQLLSDKRLNSVKETRWMCDAPLCKDFGKLNSQSDLFCFVCEKRRYPAGLNIIASEFTPLIVM